MLRIYVLQMVYNVADMAVAAEVIDSRAFSEFCGVTSSNQVPNGDTIGRFRNTATRVSPSSRFRTLRKIRRTTISAD